LALGATLLVETADGPRKIPAEEFFLDYRRTAAEDAILMSISVPREAVEGSGAFFKVAPAAVDKAMVNLGVYAEIVDGRCENVRVAVGAITRIPHRVRAVEDLMNHQELTPELVDEAAEMVGKSVEPMVDMRAPAEHRRSLLSAGFKRAVRSLHRSA